MTSVRRPMPDGFTEHATYMTVARLREKYGAGQDTVLRWLHEAGLPRIEPDRSAIAKAIAIANPRPPKPRPPLPANYPCGHPRTPENTVGQRTSACRQCQHDYKARCKEAVKLTAAPTYDRAVSEKEIREGSEKLLRAIWRAHRQIMLNLAARGRKVEAPQRFAA